MSAPKEELVSPRHFPVNIDMDGRLAVIVGGGSVGGRKAKSLLAVGARIRLVSPSFDSALTALASDGMIDFVARSYGGQKDLLGAMLVFAATDDDDTNRRVCFDAQQLGILTCSVTTPESGTFITPAVVRRGDLVVTVSTGGKSPALAAALRLRLEKELGEEYALAVELLGNARQKLLTGKEDTAYNRKLLKTLAEDRLAELLGCLPEDADVLLSKLLAEAEDKDAQ